jgi:hypothetical protein
LSSFITSVTIVEVAVLNNLSFIFLDLLTSLDTGVVVSLEPRLEEIVLLTLLLLMSFEMFSLFLTPGDGIDLLALTGVFGRLPFRPDGVSGDREAKLNA